MAEERAIKLLRLGGDQVVEIPADWELPTDEVIIRDEGVRLIIEPAPVKQSD